jgi:hypothetical protein
MQAVEPADALVNLGVFQIGNPQSDSKYSFFIANSVLELVCFSNCKIFQKANSWAKSFVW